ncbi:porin [Chitinimonas naiadis]
MKKQLLAIAVLGALAAPAFAADNTVTLYGKLNMGFESFDNGALKTTRVQDNTSYFGFKGEEDLGAGMKAWFQIENKIGTDDSNAGAFASRNSAVGLKGEFGTVLLGRWDTPFKTIKKNLDIIDGPGEQMEALLHQDQSSKLSYHTRQDNVVQYWTPNLSGFVGKISFSPDEAKADAVAGKSGSKNNNRISISGDYTLGGFNVGAAYETRKDDNAVVTGAVTNYYDSNAWRVTGSYAFDDTTIGLGYVKLERDNAAGTPKLSRPAWTATLQQKFGSAKVLVAYADAKENMDNAQNGATMWSLEGEYSLSKRSAVYAYYSAINNEAKGNYGFKNQNSATGSAPAAAGKDVKILGVGVRHTF